MAPQSCEDGLVFTFQIRKGVLFDPFFLDGVAEVPSLVQADGLHPNAEGVRKEVARLLPLVDTLLAEVRE